MQNHPTHAYAVIADTLRNEILAGQPAPGERLPTERGLAQRFHVNRLTVRRALDQIEEERLIHRRHGSGTYVSPAPTRRIPVMIDYTGSIRKHAPGLQRKVLDWGWKAPDPDLAACLHLAPPARVLWANRVDEWKGTTVACDQAFVAEPYARSLTLLRLAKVDFLEVWMKNADFSIVSCSQTIEAVPATDWVAKALALQPGQPVLQSSETYQATDGGPAGFFVSYYHPTHMCIASHYDWRRLAGPRQAKGNR